MSEGPFKLTPAQQAAAIDRKRENLALLSGAGCGKTLVLAQRFTELLMDGADPQDALGGLVAVTFTEKAALEMTQRVYQMVKDRADAAGGNDRPRLMALLGQLPGARIMTIHGFCASVLRSYAVEAGADPGFSVLADEAQRRRMLDEAIEQALLGALERGDAGAMELLGQMPLEQAADLVAAVLATQPNCDIQQFADPQATLDRLRKVLPAIQRGLWDQAWAAGLGGQLERLEADIASCDDPGDALYQHAAGQLALLRRLAEGPAGRLAEVQSLAGAGGKGSAKKWGGKDTMLAFRRALKALVEQVRALAPCLGLLGEADERAAGQLGALAELAGQSGRLFAQAKRTAGVLDFTDLLARTGELIRTHEPVRRELSEGIRQLLVDECQDTDDFQVGMLLLLVEQLGDERGDIPDGRLFVVGDEKQSIYRFRGARVEVFRELVRRLGKARQENLDISFRSHRALTGFINHLFGRLMGNEYQGVRANRTAGPAGPAVEILLARAGERAIDGNDTAIRQQARLAAQRIDQMVRSGERLVWDRAGEQYRPVRYGDIAILFSRMTRSLDFERELALRAVPYYVVAGTGFFRQQEVFDLLNALRVIDDPSDDLALAGVLRSSLFGLDDESLMRVFASSPRPVLMGLDMEKAVKDLPDGQGRALATAIDLLRGLHRIKDAVGPDELLRRLVLATGYEGVLLCQFQGLRMVGNVRMLVGQAQSAAQAGLSLSAFIKVADELVLNDERYEQAAVADEKDDVVRLMTIHKAKGLEFPVVLLVDLNAGRRSSSARVIYRQDVGLVYAGLESAADEPAEGAEDREAEVASEATAFQVARMIEDREEQAEDIRRLYVGATRAQDHLVMIGADWRSRDGDFRNTGSPLRSIDAVLGLREALDAGGTTLRYEEKGDVYEARLEAVAPDEEPRRGQSRARAGGIDLGLLDKASGPEDLAERMLAGRMPAGPDGRAVPPLLGPVVGSAAPPELAVTALEDFATCPMLYRWRHELRCPPPARLASAQPMGKHPQAALGGGKEASGTIDPLTLGTLLHLCMERLDLADPQPAALAAMAVVELGLEGQVDPAAVAGELAGMLDKLKGQPLWERLCGARRVWRELDFIWQAGPAVLRGKMDLLYEDAAGTFHLVDYKSDRVDGDLPGSGRAGDNLAEYAQRYRLQMLLYAAAAMRHLVNCPAEALGALRVRWATRQGTVPVSASSRGMAVSAMRPTGVSPVEASQPDSMQGQDAPATHGQARRAPYGDARATNGGLLVDATLYFLRSGREYRFEVTGAAIESAQAELAELAARLTAARRGGHFERSAAGLCARCPYGPLCDHSHSIVAGGLDEMS